MMSAEQLKILYKSYIKPKYQFRLLIYGWTSEKFWIRCPNDEKFTRTPTRKKNSMNQDQWDKNARFMLFTIHELQTIRSPKFTNKNYKTRTSKYRFKNFHNIKRSMSACFQLHTDKSIDWIWESYKKVSEKSLFHKIAKLD